MGQIVLFKQIKIKKISNKQHNQEPNLANYNIYCNQIQFPSLICHTIAIHTGFLAVSDKPSSIFTEDSSVTQDSSSATCASFLLLLVLLHLGFLRLSFLCQLNMLRTLPHQEHDLQQFIKKNHTNNQKLIASIYTTMIMRTCETILTRNPLRIRSGIFWHSECTKALWTLLKKKLNFLCRQEKNQRKPSLIPEVLVCCVM